MSCMLEQDFKTIEAFVDGELDDTERRKVIGKIHHNPELRSYYQKLMFQKRLLQQWWQTKTKN